jgi:hypothetical protein
MKTLTKVLLSLVLLLFVSAATFAQTVYVTRTGAKYHRGTCRYLHSSKIPTTLANAKESYTACSVCRPPTELTEDEQEEVEIKEVEENASPKVPGKNTPAEKPATASPATVSKARQCSASTKSGLRCKRTTTSSSGKCWQHE